MLEITTKLGVHTVKASGKDLKEAMEQIGFLATLPNACPICGSVVCMYHNETQDGFNYYGLVCKPADPKAQIHETSFGQRKDGSGFWYKGEWRDKGHYQAQDQQPQQQKSQPYPGSQQGRRPQQRSEYDE